MDAINPEIILGEMICSKIKEVYHPDKSWSDCYKEIAQKFTILKQISRKFYTDKEDKDILTELAKYSNQDIADIFNT